ncbi:DEAD/DEAH box helicase [Streptomyces sp. NPDC002853]
MSDSGWAVGGGTVPSRRARARADVRVLLTTPESLEAMLVSANVDHTSFFSGLRAVVVDEVHAFAGEDRGWHLLAVLERRLGRTGRRAGTSRNCLFLALDRGGLLGAAALLMQWSRGWVEPVVAPPEPRIGRTDPSLLTERIDGPRRLLLAGRSWQVTYIDWKRKRCFVEPVDGGGRAKWSGAGLDFGISFELTRAVREVLLGANPPVDLTARAEKYLAEAREHFMEEVHPGGTVIIRGSGGYVKWWTWAGHRANATLAATLAEVAAPAQQVNDCWVRLREDLSLAAWRHASADAQDHLCLPEVDERAVKGLKFAEALPPRLAESTLARRLADLGSATHVLTESVRFAVWQ